MKYDILCCGLAAYDTLLYPIDPDLMQKDGAMAQESRTGSGGDAVNASISLGRLGLHACLCALVGQDSFADLIQADVEKAGASAEGLVRDASVFTNAPVVLLDPSGERHIIRTAKGGNRQFALRHIPEDLMKKARHLHIASVNMLPCLDGEPLADLFAKAHELGLTTSMDASFDKDGLWMKKIEKVLPNCDIFIPSYQEAVHYADCETIAGIRDHFSGRGLKLFGVKLGAKGVYLTDFEQEWMLPSLYEGTPVDTTGAGDAFFAGFLGAWLKGYGPRDAGLVGSAQAASVMRQAGANRSAGSWEDAVCLIEKHGWKLEPAGC